MNDQPIGYGTQPSTTDQKRSRKTKADISLSAQIPHERQLLNDGAGAVITDQPENFLFSLLK